MVENPEDRFSRDVAQMIKEFAFDMYFVVIPASACQGIGVRLVIPLNVGMFSCP